jgi:hypothetical protein
MRLKFPAYRRYHDARVAASDSLMALLIGARLGQHALSTSPADPKSHLPDLFGLIPGIERVNRTGAAVDSSPAVANGVVYVGSIDHKLYAYHLPTGTGPATEPTRASESR